MSTLPGDRDPTGAGEWWHRLTRTEQAAWTALAIAVLAVVTWSLAWTPLSRDLARRQASAPAERTALARAQAQAAVIAGAQANATATPTSPNAVSAILARHGLRATASSVAGDGTVKLAFDGVRFDDLLAALADVQREARLAVREADISARVEPGRVRADLTLGP